MSRGVVALALVIALTGCETHINDRDIKTATLAQVRDAVDSNERSISTALIYPRSAERFARARIPGSMNLKLPQVPAKSTPDSDLQAYRQIIVYGDNPADVSARAMTKRLMAVGYKRVRLFAGGLNEWLTAGYEIDSDIAPREGQTTPPEADPTGAAQAAPPTEPPAPPLPTPVPTPAPPMRG